MIAPPAIYDEVPCHPARCARGAESTDTHRRVPEPCAAHPPHGPERFCPGPGIANADGIVVMGGPMGAFDDQTHPHLRTVRQLLRLVGTGSFDPWCRP